MSEFVEEGIEGLLPVFETVVGVQLLSSSEVDAFVKRCKAYEYRLQRAKKDPEAFKTYSEFLGAVVNLIRKRRRRMKYRMKEDEIETIIKSKIAGLYRQCCERFQGRKDLWLERIEFLTSAKMYARCSKAYFRAMQIFPRDMSLRCQAARFEFSLNRSINNARFILQQGLRLSPTEFSLWICLFELELDNIKWLLGRRSILTDKFYPDTTIMGQKREWKVAEEALKAPEMKLEVEDKSEMDAVMSLRIAEVVSSRGLECCGSDKSALLLAFWRIARRYGAVAKRLETKFYNMLWTSEYRSEESWIAKSEIISYNDDALYELFDEACQDKPTEKMHRHCLEVCKKHYLLDHDPLAKGKCCNLLFWLISQGFGTEADILRFEQLETDAEEKEKILNRELEKNTNSTFILWMLLRCKIRSNPQDVETIHKLFKRATKEIYGEGKDVFEIYKLTLDWANHYSRKDMDDIFARAAFHTPPNIACEMRCHYLRFLVAAYPENPEIYRETYMKYLRYPPNSMKVHRTFARIESKSKRFSLVTLMQSLEYMVMEFGHKTHECWIDYAHYLLKFDPTALNALHMRAMACLPTHEVDLFLVAYSAIIQKAAAQFQNDDDDDDDSDDGEDDDDGDGEDDDDDDDDGIVG